MANSNPNPTDDFDLDLNSAPSQATSGTSGRSKLATAIAFIFIAGTIFGYALPLLARSPVGLLVPETTTAGWGQYGCASSCYPDSVYGYDQPSAAISSGWVDWTYVQFPLAGRPADFTSASAVFYYFSVNFTWLEVSLVPGAWDNSTLTWNNRPLPNETIARVSVDVTTGKPYLENYLSVNVTRWVREGVNFSVCLSPVFSNTTVGFHTEETSLAIEWTRLVPAPIDPVPAVLVAVAGGAAAAGIYLAARKRGGGGK